MTSCVSRDRVGGLIDSKSVYGDSAVKDSLEVMEDGSLDTRSYLQQIAESQEKILKLLETAFEEGIY